MSVDAYRSSIIVQHLTKLKSFVMLVADKFESEGFSTHTTNIQKIQYEEGMMIVVGLSLVLAGLFTGCGLSEEDQKQRAEKEERDTRQRMANTVIMCTDYIKDPRTGLCFGYHWGSSGKSPAITCVPCGEIPTNLLIVAQVPGYPQK